MFVFIFYLGKRNSKGEKLRITLALATTPTTNPQEKKNTYHKFQLIQITYNPRNLTICLNIAYGEKQLNNKK